MSVTIIPASSKCSTPRMALLKFPLTSYLIVNLLRAFDAHLNPSNTVCRQPFRLVRRHQGAVGEQIDITAITFISPRTSNRSARRNGSPPVML